VRVPDSLSLPTRKSSPAASSPDSLRQSVVCAAATGTADRVRRAGGDHRSWHCPGRAGEQRTRTRRAAEPQGSQPLAQSNRLGRVQHAVGDEPAGMFLRDQTQAGGDSPFGNRAALSQVKHREKVSGRPVLTRWTPSGISLNCPQARADLLGCLCRGHHSMHFKIDKITPVRHPLIE